MNGALAHLAAALSAAVLLGAPAPHPVAPATMGGRPDTLVVNGRASSLRWTARRATAGSARSGTAVITRGLLVIRHEMLEQGTFTIALAPTARLETTGAERIGPARWRVGGELTMQGVTRPVTFDTDVSWAGVGHMVATSTFTIDRRQWSGATAIAADSVDVVVTIDALRKAPATTASRSWLARVSAF